MNGQIVRFHNTLGQGVIKADDGSKFRFTMTDIQNPNGKLVGIEVDFVVESRRPKDIILLHGSPWLAFGASQCT